MRYNLFSNDSILVLQPLVPLESNKEFLYSSNKALVLVFKFSFDFSVFRVVDLILYAE